MFLGTITVGASRMDHSGPENPSKLSSCAGAMVMLGILVAELQKVDGTGAEASDACRTLMNGFELPFIWLDFSVDDCNLAFRHSVGPDSRNFCKVGCSDHTFITTESDEISI